MLTGETKRKELERKGTQRDEMTWFNILIHHPEFGALFCYAAGQLINILDIF